MQFGAHGNFNVEIEGRILITDATGPFNEELVTLYRKAVQEAIFQIFALFVGKLVFVKPKEKSKTTTGQQQRLRFRVWQEVGYEYLQSRNRGRRESVHVRRPRLDVS